MTPAQALLAPIIAVMLIDMRTTYLGLSNGLFEKNGVARVLIERFGLLRGMLVYEAGILALFGGAALLFPSQWALQVVLLTDVSIAAASNLRLIKLTHI